MIKKKKVAESVMVEDKDKEPKCMQEILNSAQAILGRWL